MSLAIMLALGVSLLFAATAPALGRRLPPALATRLLVTGSLAVTISTLFVVAVIAFTWLGQLPQIAELGPWSINILRRDDPVPAAAAIGCTGVLILLAGRTCIITVRRWRALRSVHRCCRDLPAHESLVVVDAPEPDAFTTSHLHGRIVVTTGLLRALDPAERRVVLAHERSHLHHRHPWWTLAADLGAAANPLLTPTARAVAHAVERWADEDAATAVTDRALAARTLARTALLAHRIRARIPRPAPGLVDTDVPARVRALLAPPPVRAPVPAAALIALVLATAGAAATVQHLGERLFEHAGTHAQTQLHHPTATASTP